MLYKEKPPLIGACYYGKGEHDVSEFIMDASLMIGEVSEVVVRCDPRFGEVKGVRFYSKAGQQEDLLVEPETVICKERKPGGEVWLMPLEEFKKRYEAVDLNA